MVDIKGQKFRLATDLLAVLRGADAGGVIGPEMFSPWPIRQAYLNRDSNTRPLL